MISRIYVVPKGDDSRAGLYRKSWNGLSLSGAVTDVYLSDSYKIDKKLLPKEVILAAEALTNPALETYAINSFPIISKSKFIIEIGFLPGVTDNVGRTAVEEIADRLGKSFKDGEEVYTSKIFILGGTLTREDVATIAGSLHNPLIERAEIFTVAEIKKAKDLPRTVPQVLLPKKTAVISVSLNVSDEELVKIGKEGIVDPDGTRRGPLALDLESMKIIQAFFRKLKRDPSDIELESLAQTWSEHCKHTIFANSIDDISAGLYKTYIKGATNEIRKKKGKKDFCISVFSDNSGSIVFDKDYMVTHKVETHNSPSALDPFGGAITGICGVNRDTIGTGIGAKPVANMYGFCVGNPDDTRTFFRDKAQTQTMLSARRILDGVVKGINVGGNCSGIPTLSGFVKYDDRFRGKPLVFAGTVGLSPRKINGKFAHEKSAQPSDFIVVVGGRVGADGIHGATFSSVTMDSTSPATAVQIGDPITQKKLSDAIVKEARDLGLYSSITDNGAGGISCSVAEMAKECGGAIVDLDKVPLKYPGLTPWQIWISESQERITLSVPKKHWKQFESLMSRRGVEAVVIGEFTNKGNCVVKWNGKKIMDLPLEFLHNGLPQRHLATTPVVRTYAEPTLSKSVSRDKELAQLLSTGNVGGFGWISEQYDHEVQAGSVLKPQSGRGKVNTDAQVFRPVLTSTKGVVISASTYPSYSDINTYHMAAAAIDTAIRNAICAGASLSHLAILDNFCWCSSYDPIRLGELVQAVRACYDYAVGYETPFISGKDSMFNDFKGYDEAGNPVAISIPPTLLVSAIGVMNNINTTVSPEFKTAGDAIYLIGETHDELGASEYFKMIGKKGNAIGNMVPQVDWKKNKKTYQALERAISQNLIASAISVASGGLATALSKASVGGMIGITISLDKIPGTTSTIDSKLFSESQGRIVVSVAKKDVAAFEKIMKSIPHAKIGSVFQGNAFIVKNGKNKVVNTTVQRLHTAYHSFSNKMK